MAQSYLNLMGESDRWNVLAKLTVLCYNVLPTAEELILCVTSDVKR